MCYFILSYIDIVTARAAARERVFHSWPTVREYPSSTCDSNNAYMAYERGRQAGRERGRQAGREGEGGKEAGKVRVREIARETEGRGREIMHLMTLIYLSMLSTEKLKIWEWVLSVMVALESKELPMGGIGFISMSL